MLPGARVRASWQQSDVCRCYCSSMYIPRMSKLRLGEARPDCTAQLSQGRQEGCPGPCIGCEKGEALRSPRPGGDRVAPLYPAMLPLNCLKLNPTHCLQSYFQNPARAFEILYLLQHIGNTSQAHSRCLAEEYWSWEWSSCPDRGPVPGAG